MNAPATNLPANADQALPTVLRKMQPQFEMALPPHVSAEKFVRVVVTAINTNRDLQRATRDSILAAAMKCAQDGLLPDGREAALVVYNSKEKDENGRDRWVSKAQYMPMIAGILTKVRRSGELLSLSANVVFERDDFAYVLGDEERIEHKPALGLERGKVIAAYAIAKTKDGGVYREVMAFADIEKVRNVSKAKNSGPWSDWWEEMAKKTVIRRLSKRLPMSTDLQTVVQRDDDFYDLKAAEASRQRAAPRLHADFDETPALEAPKNEAEPTIEGAVVQTGAGSSLKERAAAYRGKIKAAPSVSALEDLRDEHMDLMAELDAQLPDEAADLDDMMTRRLGDLESDNALNGDR